MRLADLDKERPPLSALPIPEDVAVDDGWSETLREMADHIGAYATLKLVDRFGGLQVYVPASPDGWPVTETIGREAAEIFTRVYRGEYIDLPVGKDELFRARSAPIIAAVRQRKMGYTEGAWTLHTSRKHLSHLVNQTDRAWRAKPAKSRDTRQNAGQLDMFGDDVDEAAA